MLSVMILDDDINAPKYKKAVWAIIEATTAYVLLSAGSLLAFQTVSIAASLPFLPIMIVVIPAFIKILRRKNELE